MMMCCTTEFCISTIQPPLVNKQMSRHSYNNTVCLFSSTLKLDLQNREKNYEMLSLECGMICGRDLDSKKTDEKQLEAFDVFIWRGMLNISWKDKVTNVCVLEEVTEERKEAC